MGWAACTGGLEVGAWLLGAILYAWQFPHFNALSWRLKEDYAKAGYRMMSVLDPALNARVSLRYSLAMIPISWACVAVGMASPAFLLTSTAVNGVLAYRAVQFWRQSCDQSARGLFFASLWHLPVLLALLMVHKQSDLEREAWLSQVERWTGLDLKEFRIVGRDKLVIKE